MTIWLSRTIPMSKYFSGSRPLRHNEVQLYYKLHKYIIIYLVKMIEIEYGTCIETMNTVHVHYKVNILPFNWPVEI